MPSAVLRTASERVTLVLALISCVTAQCAAAAAYPRTTKEPGAEFFTEPAIRTFRLEIPEAGLNQLRRSPRSYVVGTVREGNRVLTNVAIRIKGMGSFRTIDEKPSLAVKFDEFATNQHYRGLSKLMFNNSVQDRTYLAELLATQLFRDAGVPAARSTHARVQLNGRDLGLYLVTEAMNKQFLKQHFNSSTGNLYEAYLLDVNVRMEQDSGEPGNQSDVRTLHNACTVTDPKERWRQLNKVLDVDRFVSFVAMEMLTSHWDGYAIHTNNYRIYHDPKTDKFVFITHGIDWAFRRPSISIQPPTKSIVGRAVLSTSEGQKLYDERIGTLFTNVFRLPVITNRIEQTLAKIRGGGLNPNELADIERRANILRGKIEERALSVSNQLRGIELEPMKFDAKGFAYPKPWRDEPDRGEPLMDGVKLDGRNTLHIQPRNERTRASWRSQVYLKRGWYRFEGMARTDLPSSGSARLRISGDTRSVGISGSGTAWRPLTHAFEVQDAGMDVEFVCELNATQGEVWFDVDSLRVRRLAPEEVPRVNLRQPVFEQ
jgi:hypothetical protein